MDAVPDDADYKLTEALQALKESEVERIKAETQYYKLESLFRKHLKSQFGSSCSTSKIDNNTYNKIEKKLNKISSQHSERAQKTVGENITAKKSLEAVCKANQKAAGENVKSSLLTKKSSGNVGGKIQESVSDVNITSKKSLEGFYSSNLEHNKNYELHNRISQYHESLENIAALNEKPVLAKNNFLRHLHKTNSDMWKNQKSSAVNILEKQMNCFQQ